MNVFSSINTFTHDIDGLINKNKIMTNEIDAIIQGLSDIHQEINQVDVLQCFFPFTFYNSL